MVDPTSSTTSSRAGSRTGLSLRENLAKEAEEEAGIPEHLIAAARPVGVIRYAKAIPHGVRRDTLYVFDLEVPQDFAPQNRDGEASDFRLMGSPKSAGFSWRPMISSSTCRWC